ncbi:MAG: hypothetical protein HY647_06415 [Acidobacteria bacterium]|nr:hypothetical protein [Acidobacteriota bacterium]
MPVYPALALLVGAALAEGGSWIRWGTRAAAAIASVAAATVAVIWFLVRDVPTPGDITTALTRNPEAYTLSLGHLQDLTLYSFAYLRLPLILAGIALLVGAVGAWKWEGKRAFLALALMMVLFVHAARLALVVFDPYLSSRPLAEALRKAPPGKMIVDGEYYPFSSVFFYAHPEGLLWNGQVNNLEYGSYAPDAPPVFIDDAGFEQLWQSGNRCYLMTSAEALPRLRQQVGAGALYTVQQSGGKFLFTNHSLE